MRGHVWHQNKASFVRDRFVLGGKMAGPLGEMGPPYSLHSISSVDSELDDMDLLSDGDDQERQNQEVFVLRERKGVIYPLDYKYRVGEFDKIDHCFKRLPRFL